MKEKSYRTMAKSLQFYASGRKLPITFALNCSEPQFYESRAFARKAFLHEQTRMVVPSRPESVRLLCHYFAQITTSSRQELRKILVYCALKVNLTGTSVS
jgi:hypothetical protein